MTAEPSSLGGRPVEEQLASSYVGEVKTRAKLIPSSQANSKSLYDPNFEHDACGVASIADIKGRKSHSLIAQSLTALRNLQHRGATGSDENTGDGAGIIIQIPHFFFKAETKLLGLELPNPGSYAIGVLFLPQDPVARKLCEAQCVQVIEMSHMMVLGFRDVPTNSSEIGPTAKNSEPFIRHIFITRDDTIKNARAFERMLYLVRRRIETAISAHVSGLSEPFYIPSLSAKTIVYKGMLSAEQIDTYYPDLVDRRLKSAIAIVHQRFSTNTFPSWSLAHPFRYIAHNGEINTVQGNKNWMKSREHFFDSDVFGKQTKELLPIIQNGSDSSTLDNVVELLVSTGMSLAHALMMLIPEPWDNHQTMSKAKKAFYNYHSSLMEPWDGPTLVVSTDGESMGAILDRNGLRPARYYITRDDKVILASEAGVIPVRAQDILVKGRLRPGRMLLIDTKQKRIIDDVELKEEIAAAKPYQQWLEKYRVSIADLPTPKISTKPLSVKQLIRRQQLYGYTTEEQRVVLIPMAKNGKEAMGSMGNDTPISVLSDKPQLLFTYFKQLFAQVTNPPLDALREKLVTSMAVLVGPQGNLLQPTAKSCRQIELPSPILTNLELAQITRYNKTGFKTDVLSIVFPVHEGANGLELAMKRLFDEADKAIAKGSTIFVLSDKGVTSDFAPIPSLLAVAGLHHHLVRTGTRAKVNIIVSCGDAREVHHFCTLIGYGASAVNPYLAYATIGQMVDTKMLRIDVETAQKNYRHAAHDGILKVMSKIGISTLNSYRGAQIFEAVGLNNALIDTYFTNTSSRISGIGLEEIAQEVAMRHTEAYLDGPIRKHQLPIGGEYQWRVGGRRHFYSPEIINKLQLATRTSQYSVFKEYSNLVNSLSADLTTLRGLFELKNSAVPIPLSEVEPTSVIVRRFTTGAMSYGSISQEAHETIAIAMNRLGGKSNTGEGGEDPERFLRDSNGDLRRSSIKQVASGRFGVTSEYLVNADEIQIKMAQGAKPGEGGQLPGEKVYPWIAKVRNTTPGVGLISPPPHHDIYSIEDLMQLIYDLKNANPKARISVKLAAEVGVGTVAAGVAKSHADMVVISGHEGGTGSAPLTSLKYAGIPWEIGLVEAHQVLMKNGLRSRITIQTDGQLKTGRDVIVAALLGAEEYAFATAPLVVLGCVMMRVCHLDTCPVGIATQNPELRKRFAGNPDQLVNFFTYLAEEVREYMAQLGFRTMDEVIGRADRLNFKPAYDHWKAKGLDLSALLVQPDDKKAPRRRIQDQNHGLEKALDHTMIKLAAGALQDRTLVRESLRITNTNRTVGTMLGYEITKRFGEPGLRADTIKFKFFGSAGQSFGAFIPRGLTLTLEGDANDHVGKGLSGGKIIVYPRAVKGFAAEDNVIIGNVALYGATSGDAFFNGIAGERFAVRNSGAVAVVEGVGDHGCEYMTGGMVVVLGEVGRNFGAGMSGGVAFILDQDKLIEQNCNKEMVDLDPVTRDDQIALRALIARHFSLTKSSKAAAILNQWETVVPYFVKIMPKEYKRVLAHERDQNALARPEQVSKAILEPRT